MKNFRELECHQLFDQESSTFTYLIYDPIDLDGVLIDPVREQLSRDLSLVNEIGVKLRFVLETHIHADHITSAAAIGKKTGAEIAVSSAANLPCADRLLKDGEEVSLKSFKIRCMATPGHTSTCMSYFIAGAVFSGDTLLIRGCGRTDFQEGSATELFKSVREKLFSLPDDTLVFPAHDYKGFTHSSIALEKRFNPRLGLQKSQIEFEDIMAQLTLDMPKKIRDAVPANLQCGKSLDAPAGG